MPVAVDLEAKTVHASARDLALRPLRRRDGGMWQRLRVRLGNEVHERYAAWCEREAPATQTEVSTARSMELAGCAVSVRGRMDGVMRDGDAVCVEEVKSALDHTARLSTTCADDYPGFRRQLWIYGLCMAGEYPGREVRLRLVLGSIVDRGWHRIDIDFDVHRARRWLRGVIAAAIADARREHARSLRRARAARALRFPYPDTRAPQQTLMAAIQRGLEDGRPVIAVAPTGVGKTIGALLPALGHALERGASVYFATSKTTQQQVAADAFERVVSAARPVEHRLCAVTLRAKERMCPPGDLACHPDLCSYLGGAEDRIVGVSRNLVAAGGHLTPDAIYAAGDEARACPFEVSLAVAERADLVIGDYNYAFDRSPGAVLPRVVVVDEAHNLFDRARSYASPFVSRDDIAALPPRFAALTERVVAAIDHGLAAVPSASMNTEPIAAALAVDEWRAIAEDTETAMVEYVVHKRNHGIKLPRDPVNATLRTVLHLCELLAQRHHALVSYVSPDGSAAGTGVGILCVDPQDHLAHCHRTVVATIAISATLEPVGYYRDVLGFRDLNPVTVTVGSPFPRRNRCVLVVPTIETTYRQRTRHVGGIAAAISEVSVAHPGNYAAFFPSYSLLAQVAPLIRTDARCLVQERAMTHADRAAVIERLRAADTPHLLLAVMGGVFAEGIDLPGTALIGAIIVGPGLPGLGFERRAMRAHFDREYGDGFAYAMLYPGMQRVVQSAGRVIRTDSDRGIIALLGRRFLTRGYRDCLPPDWVADGVTALCSRTPGATAAAFWSGHEPTAPQGAFPSPAIGAAGRRSPS